MTAKKALVVGASGLIGAHCVDELLRHPAYDRVEIWVRRPLQLEHARLVQRQVDFDRLGEQALDAQDVFCCLGTTIKVAGSQEAFRKVDYTYPLELARLSAKSGVGAFLMVSALGANADSSVFYNRVKGEVERDIRGAGLACWHFFRPSLLDGERTESRPGERVGIAIGRLIGPLMLGGLARYRPIKAAAVARAMVAAANMERASGALESDEISRIAAA